MKDLIPIPEYSSNVVRVVKEVRVYVNGVLRNTSQSSYTTTRNWGYGHRRLHEKINIFFNQFISKVYKGGGHNSIWGYRQEAFLMYNPLKPLNDIKKRNPKLKINKFISNGTEKLNFKYEKYLPPGIDSLCYEVDYIEIRDPIISYLKQKVGDNKVIKEIGTLFSKSSNCGSYVEQLEKKANYLLNLDLNNYVEELNKGLNKDVKR